MKKTFVTLMLMVTSLSANANFILNGGFETGDFSHWSVGGETIAAGVERDGFSLDSFTSRDPTYTNVRSGEFSAYAIVRRDPLERIFLMQDIPVVAGTTYKIGYWVGADSSASGFGFLAYPGLNEILVDGLSLKLFGPRDDRALETGSTPSDFIEVFGRFAATETRTVSVSYQIMGSGTGRAGFSLDDFYAISATDVPEPSSLFILWLGLAGLAASRSINKGI